MEIKSTQKFDDIAKQAIDKMMQTESWKSIILKTQAETDEDSGTFKSIISSDAQDRQGEVVDQDGIDISSYMKNPIVLWAHDYGSMPIGITTKIYRGVNEKGNKVTYAEGKFAPASINPFAQQVRRAYDMGLLNTHSIGFIPKEWDNNRITKSEMLEHSIVPVPANEDALAVRSFNYSTLKGLDLTLFRSKGLNIISTKGAVPKDVSEKLAPKDESWSAPSLKDFTDKEWSDLTDEEKRHIAGHYAWAKELPPESFGDLKLPHHRASDGAVVFKGVVAAMAALNGARGGAEVDGDKEAVYNHLAKHYKQFEEDPPTLKAEEKAATVGSSCQLDDGTPGVFAHDPKDPKAPLVCVPEEDKTKSMKKAQPQDDQDAIDTLHDELKSEHAEHKGNMVGAITKHIEEFKAIEEAHSEAIEEFKKKAADGEDDNDGDEEGKKPHEKMTKAIEEFKKSIEEFKSFHEKEHDRHVKTIKGLVEDCYGKIMKSRGDESADEKPGDDGDVKELLTRMSAIEAMLKASDAGSNAGKTDGGKIKVEDSQEAMKKFLFVKSLVKDLATLVNESLADVNQKMKDSR